LWVLSSVFWRSLDVSCTGESLSDSPTLGHLRLAASISQRIPYLHLRRGDSAGSSRPEAGELVASRLLPLLQKACGPGSEAALDVVGGLVTDLLLQVQGPALTELWPKAVQAASAHGVRGLTRFLLAVLRAHKAASHAGGPLPHPTCLRTSGTL
jgi:hypothetical protein